MIIDQLFENNKKPLNEVDPRNFDSDEDYYAALNAPAKRRSAPSDYPYSSQEDDAYFNDIFRKKREAAKKAAQDKESGLEEGLTDFISKKFGKTNQIDPTQLARMMSQEKIPQEVISNVFRNLNIPYTAPASAQKSMPFYGTNPATEKPWTYDELQAKARAGQAMPATDAAATTPATSPAGFNAGNVMNLPGMEKYAAKPASAEPARPNFAQQRGYAQVNQPVTAKYNMPGASKPATAPAMNLPTGKIKPGSADAQILANLQKPGRATISPNQNPVTMETLNRMLETVQTKDDVQKIKQYIDRQFTKHGLVSESAFATRNKLIEHVTQVGAQRRREYARKS